MKYFYKIFIAAIFFTSYLTVNAQVATNYSFAQAAGGITALTATYTQHTSGTTDSGTYPGIPIGFTFSFNCVDYTTVSISNDGYIVMGNTITNSTTPLSSGTDNNVIAALAADLQGLTTGSLRSKTAGTAPNRTFTVEWLHYEKWLGADDYSFQIILYETTNTIQIKYTSATTVADNTFQVGLRGATNSDFNNRTKASNTSWIASTAGAVNTAVMTTGGNATRTASGIFTWTFTGSVCSGTPTAGTATASPATVCSGTPTTLTLTGGSTGCGISYQWQSAAAAAGPWTNIAGATTNPYSVSPTVATYYRCVLTCANGGGTANSTSLHVTMAAPSSCYCTPSGSSASYFIDDFSTTGGSTNITNNNSGYSTGGYGVFTGMTVTQVQNSSVNFSTDFVGGSRGFAIWVDWNQNGTFEVSEKVFVTSAYVTGVITGSFTVPLSALPGNTRMRIKANYFGSTPSDPCRTSFSGEVEDYTFNVVAIAPCTGIPTGGSTTASTSGTGGHVGAISVTGSTAASGLAYQWYSASAAAGPWTLIPGATGITYAPTVYGLYYRRVITCTASGGTANSTSLQYNSTAPPPPANDLCANATALPCGTSNLAGTTINTSNIAHGTGCSISNYGVWYTFTGDGDETTISSTADFDHAMAIASGSCGSLTNISCHDSGLSGGTESVNFTTTLGVQYYVYIAHYSSGSTTTGNFTISRSCGNVIVGSENCEDAMAVCADAGSAGVDFGVTTNSPIITAPAGQCSYLRNPTWWYFQIESLGYIEMEIASSCGDVDFACYGPFDNITCDPLDLTGSGSYTWYNSGNSGTTYTGTDPCVVDALALPSGNLADASYSNDATEILNINPVSVGEYYVVIIGNYANCDGVIDFNQTNYAAPGAGFVDCDIVTQCDITSITANTVLTGSTYTVSGNINFADAPADGTLTICAGTICQTFDPPFTSPIAYSLSGLTADGAQHQLVATFVSGTTNCNKLSNYTAPLAIGPITPIFTPVGPYCSGAAIPALPTSSDNVPAITGTWSPAINNAATTTYTFTPATGQNASNANMVITITNPSNSGLTNGDYVWSGNTNSNWETASNWLVYDGTGFAVASVIPSIANNVFIRASGTCFTSSPAVNTSVVATCKNLTIDNSNTLYLNASSNLNIDGSLYNHGTIQTTGSSTIQISGNWNNSGTFSPGTGTVIFSGSSGISTIYTGGAEIGKQFHNVIINSSSTVNLGGDVRINNDFTISITIPDIGFNCQTYTMSVGGNWARLSGLFNRGTGSVSLTGSAKDIAGEHTIFRNLDISGMYTLTAPILTCMRTAGVGGDLNIASGASLTAQSNTINVQGNWTNSGIYNAGSETVTFNGNLVQTIISGGSSFNNVVFNNTTAGINDINLNTPMTINGNATFTEGIVYYSGTGSLTFGNSATSNIGNANSYVNGIVAKTGTSTFNFAVGEGGFWGPCAISAPSSASSITAQYIHTAGPLNWNVAYMCAGSGMDHTSGVEHWLLTSNAEHPAVTLYWNSLSGVVYPAELVVAHYNSTCWENKGGVGSGTASAGSVTSTVAFASYSPITFGTLTKNNPLPIVLAAFDAVCNDDAKQLYWTTLTEVNNHYFTLEKSINGVDFESIAQVQGEGNSNQVKHYNYRDNDLSNEVIYYKLSQTDFDGTTKVFPMIAVDCSQESEISIVPNPFKSTIQISGLSTDCLIDIYGARGEKIQSIKHHDPSTLEMNLEYLSPGIYFVRIIDAKGMSKNFKIIKT